MKKDGGPYVPPTFFFYFKYGLPEGSLNKCFSK